MTKTEAAVLALLGLTLVAILSLAVAAGREWDQFKVAHQCKKVAHVSGDMYNTVAFDARGQAVIGIAATPDKEGWLCDDGITYYR